MKEFAALIRPFARRLSNMITRGVVAVVDATTKMQTLQIKLLAGEVKDNVEHFEPYGYTSRPKAGAEHVTLFMDGDRSHGVTIVVADRRYRLTGLQEGEVALHDDLGQKVHLTRTGIVVVSPIVTVQASTKVRMETPLVEATQNMTIAGTLGVTGMATVGGLTSNGAAGGSSFAGSLAITSGNLSITGGNVTADGISLKAHVHGGVTTGSGTTGAAQ